MYTAKQFLIRRFSSHFNLTRPSRRRRSDGKLGSLAEDSKSWDACRQTDRDNSPRNSISTSIQDILPATHIPRRNSSSLSEKYVDFIDLCSRITPPSRQMLTAHGDMAKNRRARRLATTTCKALTPIREIAKLQKDENRARRRNSISGSSATHTVHHQSGRKRHHSLSTQGLSVTPSLLSNIQGFMAFKQLGGAAATDKPDTPTASRAKPRRPARPPPSAWPGVPATVSQVAKLTGMEPSNRRSGTPPPPRAPTPHPGQPQEVEQWGRIASVMHLGDEAHNEKYRRIVAWIRKIDYGASPY
ncbi:hypothetical protein FRC03_005994 [Tulasnella sp. 419]|nr:hypothetical protein FRC02_004779 [Tulasnella sp. 418]KAG8960929.1 hypothetical protein FRC03_005994 [Tulasnella sp. 419]